MATYLLLQKHTTIGRQRLRKHQESCDRGSDVLEQLGGEVLSEYYGTIGEFDTIWVVDLPDLATVEQAQLMLECEGVCQARTYPVFGPKEYHRILEDVVA